MPKIHNRGRVIGEGDRTKTVARKIIYPKGWDANGEPIRDGKKVLSDVLLPGQHKEVTDEQLAHLKANCPNEIINLDDASDMQAQFKEAAPPATREGYLAPDEVEARVAARVKEELAKATLPPAPTPPIENGEPAPEGSLAAQIEAMDRGDLLAFIEKESLDIAVKNYKQPAALKGAILTAMANKKAAEAEDAA